METITTITKSGREKALVDVERYAAAVNEWAGRQAAVEGELVALEEGAGRALLDDETGSEGSHLATHIAQLRVDADLAGRARLEAAEREMVARRAAVAAEADDLEPAVADARDAIKAHEARTAKLVKALQDFTGGQWRQLDEDDYRRMAGGAGSWDRPRLEMLRDELRGLEWRQAILRAVAQGVDPRTVVPPEALVNLPQSVHPDHGLIPAPGFTSPAALRAQVVEERESAQALVDEAAARVESLTAALEDHVPEVARDAQVALPEAERELRRCTRQRDNCVATLARLDEQAT